MKRIGVWLALLLSVFVAVPAFAGVTIDFGTGLAGVSGTYALNGSNAIGSNISVGVVTISGAPANNGGFLVTGNCAGGILPSAGCLSFDTASNFIQIVGAIPSLGINTVQTLLTGTFASFVADGNGLHTAIGPDTKSATLLTAVGLPLDFQFNFFGFSLTTTPILNNPGTGSVISTDIRNDGVPEPASIVLFGTVLLISGTFLRRRMSSQQQ